MTDEELGRKIEDVLHKDGRNSWSLDICREVGAAARAALTGPEVTREDVERRLESGPVDASWNDNTVLQVMDAIRYFARAPGGKVPSVEGIVKAFRQHGERHGQTLYETMARVAHTMMLEIGGRAEMMIDGMTAPQIEAEMLVGIAEKNRRMEGVLYVQECSKVAHRLATTPRTVDADKEAKRLAWEFHKAAFTTFDAASPDELWASFKDYQLVGWRAVAKGKADE